VKPPAAQSYFDLKRIGQQRPDPCDAAPKGTDTVSGAVVAGYLLIKISAHPGRQANWKMLVERRLDMKLVAALVVRRGIAQILHADPFERADITSNTYWDWVMYKGYIALGAQAVVAKFLATFKEYPPSQRPASFTIDQAMEKLKQNLGD
jgi:hypothetical protein